MSEATGARNPFLAALARPGPVLLDGGLATELEFRGHDLSTPLWSAALLRDAPEDLLDVAMDFLQAGAQCVTSASYQASREGFARIGLDAAQADALIRQSVEIAIEARRRFLRAHPRRPAPFVVASVGPWGAAQADGSEYTGAYVAGREALRAFHRDRLALLDGSGADVLGCETIPNGAEAEVLGALLRDATLPAWVSFSCRDAAHLADGTPLREAAARFTDHPRVLAVGVNCVAPELVSALIAELRAGAPDLAVVVYPNSGERWDAARRDWHGPDRLEGCAADAVAWHAAGAKLIGGCCRTRPKHITTMGAALAAQARHR